MPLHLLSKKSWNVYNTDNIAKVKHDEALAAASEAAEEQRMQEADAENRIRILRGLPAAPLATSEPLIDGHAKNHKRRRDQEQGRDRKRRRIAGEDETEMEIRIARENAAVAPSKPSTVQARPRNDMPLMDGKGHIDLFPIETPSSQKSAKNADAEAEAAKKKREYEDQYTMRFSNAAGFKQDVGQQPWYSSVDANAQDGYDEATATLAKDVWGNEDPRRKDRYTKNLTANDPLSAMNRGVEELREVEKERNRWKEERDRDIQELIDSERPSRSSRKERKSREIGRFESEDERLRKRRRKSRKKRKSGDENGFYSDGENASNRSSRKKWKPRGDGLDSLDDEPRSDAFPPEHASDHHHQKRQKRNACKERSSQQSHHPDRDRDRGRSRDRSRRQSSSHRRSDRHHHRKNSSIEEPATTKVSRQEAQGADMKRSAIII